MNRFIKDNIKNAINVNNNIYDLYNQNTENHYKDTHIMNKSQFLLEYAQFYSTQKSEDLNINNKIINFYYFFESLNFIKLNLFSVNTQKNSLDFQNNKEIDFLNYKLNLKCINRLNRDNIFTSYSYSHKIFDLYKNKGFTVFKDKKISEIMKIALTELGLKCQIQSLPRDPQMELLLRYNESWMNFLNRCCFLTQSFWLIRKDEIIIAPINILSDSSGIEIELTDEIMYLVSQEEFEEQTGSRFFSYDSNNPTGEFSNEIKSENNYTEVFFDDFSSNENLDSYCNYFKDSHENNIIIFYTNLDLNLFQKVKYNNISFYVVQIEYIAAPLFNFNYTKIVIAKNKVNPRIFKNPIANPQKATVVLPESGSECNEIFKDEKERVMINFHFDNTKTKVFAPVLQDLSFDGENCSFSIPRGTAEVWIDFENGNPNYPIIQGCLYNMANTNSFKTTEIGTSLKSIGSPDRLNEIRVELKKDKEKVYIEVPKDIELITQEGIIKIFLNAKKGNGHLEIVLENGNGSYNIKNGNKLIKLDKGNMSIEISDTLDITAKNINITAKENIKIHAGQNVKIDATENIETNSLMETKIASTGAMSLNSKNVLNCDSVMDTTIKSKTNLSIRSIAQMTLSSIGPANFNFTSMLGIKCLLLNVESQTVANIKSNLLMNLESGLMLKTKCAIFFSDSGIALLKGVIMSSDTLLAAGQFVAPTGFLKGIWIPG